MFWHCVAGVVIAGMLALAWPRIVYQATSDDGDWYSGATPDCAVWDDPSSPGGLGLPVGTPIQAAEAGDLGFTNYEFYEQEEDE